MRQSNEEALKAARLPPLAQSLKRKTTWREAARAYKRELLSYVAAGKRRNLPPTEIRFCLFSSGRTGSTLFFDLANSHPDIQCEEAKQAELLRNRFFLPHRYIAARATMSTAKTYGFKLQPSHLLDSNPTDPARFIQQLQTDGWKLVVLTRRDLLRQAISLAVALQTRVWHQTQSRQNPPAPRAAGKLCLDLELLGELIGYVEQNRRFTSWLMRDIPHLKLEYEADLLTEEQQQRSMQKFFEFLNLPAHPVRTSFQRTGKDSLHDMLENADDVIAMVRETHFEQFLSDSDR